MRNNKKPSTVNRILKSLVDLSKKEKKKQGTLTNVIKSLAELSDSNSKQRTGINRQGTGIKTCRYWNCNRNIRANYFLCPEHYQDLGDYVINKCPQCGRYKDVEYDICKDCYAIFTKKNVVSKSDSRFRREHSKSWEKGDEGVEKFFVYILKSDKGEFYVGQTRDLRLRLGEHRDGKTNLSLVET